MQLPFYMETTAHAAVKQHSLGMRASCCCMACKTACTAQLWKLQKTRTVEQLHEPCHNSLHWSPLAESAHLPPLTTCDKLVLIVCRRILLMCFPTAQLLSGCWWQERQRVCELLLRQHLERLCAGAVLP